MLIVTEHGLALKLNKEQELQECDPDLRLGQAARKMGQRFIAGTKNIYVLAGSAQRAFENVEDAKSQTSPGTSRGANLA